MGNTAPTYEAYQYSIWRSDIPQLPGHSKELVNIFNKDSPGEVNVGYKAPNTLWEQYRETAQKFKERQFLGTRNLLDEATGNLTYSWKTHGEIFELMEFLARGMSHLGLCPEK